MANDNVYKNGGNINNEQYGDSNIIENATIKAPNVFGKGTIFKNCTFQCGNNYYDMTIVGDGAIFDNCTIACVVVTGTWISGNSTGTPVGAGETRQKTEQSKKMKVKRNDAYGIFITGDGKKRDFLPYCEDNYPNNNKEENVIVSNTAKPKDNSDEVVVGCEGKNKQIK